MGNKTSIVTEQLIEEILKSTNIPKENIEFHGHKREDFHKSEDCIRNVKEVYNPYTKKHTIKCRECDRKIAKEV